MDLLKMRKSCMEKDKFSIEIGILNGILYLIIVLSGTYVDANLDHIIYGIRHYPLGYSVGWFSLLIFYLTFKINAQINRSKESKAILTFLLFIVPNIFLNYVNFRPEFPHPIYFFGTIIYVAIILLIIYVHNIKLKFEFVNNKYIDKNAKIERIKLDYDMLKNIFFALIAGFSAWTLVWIQGAEHWGINVSDTPQGQELVRTHIIFLTTIASFLGVRLIVEVVKKIFVIRDQLEKIRN
jgi:hypothetical protein